MKLTTRRAVIVGVVVAQVASLLALFFVSGRIAADAESDHQNALLNTESAEAVDRLRAHIQPAESIVQLSSIVLADAAIEPASLRNSFREAMELSPQLDGVFVGGADGSFLYVSRDGDGYREKYITFPEDLRETLLVFLDSDGDEVSRNLDPSDNYDPTQRPWFQAASANNEGVTWTDPYVFFTSQQLGITAASPIVVDGEVVGVIGADLELGSLSRFLSSIDSGTDGSSIIVNHDGVVIAHPQPELIQRMVGDSFETVSVSELEDPQARAAIASFVAEGADSEEKLTSFTTADDVESRGSFRNVRVGDGDWTVAVFGPADSLVGNLASARSTERSLLVVASLLGLILVLLVGSRATRPLDELESHAWSDSLTGLPNRRSILRSVDRDLTSVEWSSVAMVDIDNFKLVNDTYGHQVGDEVLAEVARRAETSLPEGATIGRLGGEEFLIVMPDAGISDAWQICEQVRSTVRSTPVQHSTGALEVTVSLGLATAPGDASRDQLISVADVALLEAKSTGRDKVVSGSGPRSINLDVG